MLNSDFWKRYFKVYDVLNLVIPYRELLEEIINEADIKRGDLVLDAGIGTGNLAILLEKKGAKIIGLDFSKEALDICRKKNIKAELIFADLSEKLPFSDNYFDKIVSNNTLYNISREKRLNCIVELKRVLRPGGKIVLANIHNKFKSIKIYLAHIKEIINRFGFLYTIKFIIRMFVPTIKMFYYSFIIQKENKSVENNLFYFDEQKELLKKAGFIEISETKKVFANQGILNSGYKK